MEFNWCALAVAILKNVLPEQAFELMERNVKLTVSNDDVPDMIKMRQQGMTFRQIGDVYGLTASNIFTRIKKADLRQQVQQN